MAIGKQIWVLAGGRLLSAIGSGFTTFYAPIFFVNVVGLRPSVIGLGLSAAGVAGIVARVISGSLSDSNFGKKSVILLSALVLAASAFILSITNNFPLFVIGAACMGVGSGLYWPASQAFIADCTEDAALNEAFGITFLADFVGLSLGVVLGGLLLSAGGNSRSLFVIDGLSCLLYFVVVYVGLIEPRKEPTGKSAWEGWEIAIKDWRLQVYVCFNLLFTGFVMQVETTLPLFFKNFIHYQSAKGFSAGLISGLFAEYIILMALIQMPTAKRLGSVRRTKVLMAATALMFAGFGSIWLAAICPSPISVLAASIVAMALFALSLVLYGPTASALVAEIAPPDARGVYLSINSLCWAAGGAIGAPVGLAALELPDPLDIQLWLALAISALVALGMMLFLDAKIPVSQGS